jgi:protein-tyrosine phosphatase
MAKKKIMFVCQGNICRSPLAHGLFADLVRQRGLDDRYEIDSTGVSAYHEGENVDRRMRDTAAKHGVRLAHRARTIRPADIECNDLILAMDNGNYSVLLSNAGAAAQSGKIHMFRSFDPLAAADLDVPDPWYGGMNGFEKVYEIVERTCAALLEQLEAERTDD